MANVGPKTIEQIEHPSTAEMALAHDKDFAINPIAKISLRYIGNARGLRKGVGIPLKINPQCVAIFRHNRLSK